MWREVRGRGKGDPLSEGPRKTTATKNGPHPLQYYLYGIEIERDSLEIRIENTVKRQCEGK